MNMQSMLPTAQSSEYTRARYLSITGSALGLYGVGLNHSNVIFGVNLSLADPIALLLLFGLATSGSLWIARGPILFFLTLSLSTISVSILLTEAWLPTNLPGTAIAREYVKLLASFASFIIGASLARLGGAHALLRCFTLGAAAISGVALMGVVAPISSAFPDLYYGGFRFRGLMNDPNYFAVISVAALAIAWRDTALPRFTTATVTTLLVSGILLSGSKTGLVTLVAWACWRALTSYLAAEDQESRSIASLRRILVIGIGLAALAASLVPAISAPLASAMASNAATARMAPLLLDFDTAVADGGSSRDSAWAAAARLIDHSPVFGVGVGGYLEASETLSGERVLAHNTFLQLGAEWGLPLTILFFVWAVRQVLPALLTRSPFSAWRSSAEAFMVLLAGSMGLSLNNSRLFWLLLGVAAYYQWAQSRPPSNIKVEARLDGSQDVRPRGSWLSSGRSLIQRGANRSKRAC